MLKLYAFTSHRSCSPTTAGVRGHSSAHRASSEQNEGLWESETLWDQRLKLPAGVRSADLHPERERGGWGQRPQSLGWAAVSIQTSGERRCRVGVSAFTEFISSRSLLRLQSSRCCGSQFFFKTTKGLKKQNTDSETVADMKRDTSVWILLLSYVCWTFFFFVGVQRFCCWPARLELDLSDLNVNWWLWHDLLMTPVFVPPGLLM